MQGPGLLGASDTSLLPGAHASFPRGVWAVCVSHIRVMGPQVRSAWDRLLPRAERCHGGAGLVYPTGTLYTAAPRPPRARSCGFCCRWLNESWARGKQRPPPGRTGGPAGQGSAAQRLRGRGRRWREGVWEPCLPSKAHRSCQLLCGLGLQRCPQGPPGRGQLPARDSGPDRHPALWAFAVLSERRSGSTCVVRPMCV